MSGPDGRLVHDDAMVPEGRYLYKYDAVGQGWRSDPGNIAQVGFDHDSVLVVGPLRPPEVSHRGDGTFAATFRYHPPRKIRRVLAGTFNGWRPTGHAMQGPDAEGCYTTTISLPAGRHEYKFVVDGTKWLPDPGNAVEWGKNHNSVVWARP